MRPVFLRLPLALAVAVVSGACGSAAGPTDAALLRTDSLTITEPANLPPHPIEVFLGNSGDRPIHVALCNLPAPNVPSASLVLQQEAPDHSWIIVAPYVTCPDPSNGFDQVVAPGREVRVARVLPAFASGRFRYQLSYAAADGTTATVVSAPITVIYQ